MKTKVGDGQLKNYSSTANRANVYIVAGGGGGAGEYSGGGCNGGAGGGATGGNGGNSVQPGITFKTAAKGGGTSAGPEGRGGGICGRRAETAASG